MRRLDIDSRQLKIRCIMGTEGQDPGYAGFFSMAAQPFEMAVIPIQYRRPVSVHASEYLRLGVRDSFLGFKEFQMGRFHIGDDGNFRSGELRERCDFARCAHAHLEHTELCVAGQPRETERQAPVIVQIAGRRRCLALPAKHQGESVLRASLACAAGNGGNFCGAAVGLSVSVTMAAAAPSAKARAT